MRQFRRYFERFEGRIREPPFAVYDDLAYTQGSPPERKPTSPIRQDTGNLGAMLVDPDEDGFGKRLRGSGNEIIRGDAMAENFTFDGQFQSNDLWDLYNLPMLPEQQPPPPTNYAESVEPLYQNTNPFGPMPEAQTFQSMSASPVVLSPFDLRSVKTTSSHHSGSGVASGTQGTIDELPSYLLPQGGADGWDELFGDMPDLPALHGAFEPAFLDYLNTPQ